MNPAAALSRELSGKHLSFSSNLHGFRFGINRIGGRRSSDFGSRLNYANHCETNCIRSEGQFGFDYAKERLEKRQMFLRSYHFTTKEAEESRNSNSNSTLSQKGKTCLFRLRAALWTVFACSPPCTSDHTGFVRVHRQANPSSSQLCGQRR